MKNILILLSFLTIFSLISCSNETNINTNLIDEKVLDTVISQPDRKIDIYWKVISQEWNEITISQVDTSKDSTFNMSPEEKKKYMQSLDEAARIALKEEINNSILWQVKLIAPVWIPMTKKTAQWSDAISVEASLADIKVWGYLSIWLNNDIKDQKVAEFVKISFIQ